MSATTQRQALPLAEALQKARALLSLFAPACDRIEIAGSIRRGKAQVKDIELVLVGKPLIQFDLFGGESVAGNTLDVLCDDMLATGRLTQRLDVNGVGRWGYGARYAWHDGVALDLFGTELERFGLIWLIRTGPSAYSRRLVTPRLQGGMLPIGMRVEGGWLWDGGRRVETPTEEDVYQAIGAEWVAPEDRR